MVKNYFGDRFHRQKKICNNLQFCGKLHALSASDRPKQSRVRERGMGTRLYVGNLSYTTTEERLGDLFAEAGTVKSAAIITERDTGRSRGFGFVEMSTEEEAQQAIKLMHGRELDGRVLVVNEARPREDRPRGRHADQGGSHSWSSERRERRRNW